MSLKSQSALLVQWRLVCLQLNLRWWPLSMEVITQNWLEQCISLVMQERVPQLFGRATHHGFHRHWALNLRVSIKCKPKIYNMLGLPLKKWSIRNFWWKQDWLSSRKTRRRQTRESMTTWSKQNSQKSCISKSSIRGRSSTISWWDTRWRRTWIEIRFRTTRRWIRTRLRCLRRCSSTTTMANKSRLRNSRRRSKKSSTRTDRTIWMRELWILIQFTSTSKMLLTYVWTTPCREQTKSRITIVKWSIPPWSKLKRSDRLLQSLKKRKDSTLQSFKKLTTEKRVLGMPSIT